MTYDDPFAFIHDVVNQKIPLHAVSMQQWAYGVMTAMTIRQCPAMDITVLYKGSFYKFHHRISQVATPSTPEALLRTMQ